MCTSCHMYIYIHTHAHTQFFFKVEITKELIHYLLVDDPLPYKETQVWAFEWKSKSADDRRKGQAFAELPQQSNTKKRQHVEYKQLNFSLRPWRSKGSFFSIRATPPAVSLPPVGTKQIPPSLMSLPQPKWVPPLCQLSNQLQSMFCWFSLTPLKGTGHSWSQKFYNKLYD